MVLKQYNFPFILAVEVICTSFSFLEHCADYEHNRAANMITPQTVYGKVDNKIRLLLYYTIKYSKTTI